MSEFVREPRYVVFKIKDIDKHCPPGTMQTLQSIGMDILAGRIEEGRGVFNAVVVEQDWPEFDVVWAMIEKRMVSGEAQEPCKPLRVYLDGVNEIEYLRARVAELEADKQRMIEMPTASESARVIAYRDALASSQARVEELEQSCEAIAKHYTEKLAAMTRYADKRNTAALDLQEQLSAIKAP